jgi:hypothetical protein
MPTSNPGSRDHGIQAQSHHAGMGFSVYKGRSELPWKYCVVEVVESRSVHEGQGTSQTETHWSRGEIEG